MKIIRFEAEKVRGYMNFNIAFDKQLSFLIGINGTGKTTVLKLISALLTPSYFDLVMIDFSDISLTCESLSEGKPKQLTINCTKRGNKMTLSFYNDSYSVANECFIPDSSVVAEMKQDIVDDDLFRGEAVKFESSNVFKEIKKLPSIIVLGLNRKVDYRTNSFIPDYRDRIVNLRSSRHFNDMNSDTLNDALSEIVMLIHNRVRQNANGQYRLADVFRKRVFAESFRVENQIMSASTQFEAEIEKIAERRVKLNDAIDKIGLTDLTEQFELYFDSIEKTLEMLSDKSLKESDEQLYFKTLLQWMIKSAQIEKIDNIIGYANEYAENIKKINDPIQRFVESVNMFFKESGKEIEVDKKGELCVKILGVRNENTIYDLSSGEKQLVVMLARIALHSKNNYPSIFIIDEPELSLHISWQELFVDALLKASPKTQFILATHAPAIVSDISRRSNCIDLSSKQ